MRLPRNIVKALTYVLVWTVFTLNVPFNVAQAAMVGTENLILNEAQGPNDRQRLHTFLARQDVQAAIEVQGINATEAKYRVESLSDAEVSRIVGKLDQLPAGGDAAGAIVGAALLIFLVLLFTDLLGLTDVFPFVKK